MQQIDATTADGGTLRLLVEGWRGVNHSFAMVNQCQLLELLRIPGISLYHRDLPFAMPHWKTSNLDAGFSPDDAARIAALREPEGAPVDAIMRICSPFRSAVGCPEARDGEVPTLTFMVTEMGLSEKSFAPGADSAEAFTRDANAIFTPTRWSRERLLEWGFAPAKVHVVTHGVDSRVYHPVDDAERALNRRNLGLADGQFAFLNLGAAMWNKGLDVLLLAYATLRQKHKHLRLLLKDQRTLYGVSIDGTLARLCQDYPARFDSATLASISAVTANLSQPQLRQLYGVADCYASPYRAEGFNLPVLEAIACGTPAVVTRGGATDDFCDPSVALAIDSRPGRLDNPAYGRAPRFQEPDLDATVHTMDRLVQGQGLARGAAFNAASARLVRKLGWKRPVDELLALVRQPVPAGAAA